MLTINDKISIPDEEFRFTYSRSSGPGGQNVNKVASKVTLHWGVNSAHVPDDVRARFRARFESRINRQGQLVITSQRFRDQVKNIADCLDKLREMLLGVVVAPKKRKPTKRTRGSQERRLREKHERSQRKDNRRSSDW